MVRELFVMARQHAPSIIFMDEIDSIGGTRIDSSSGGDSEVQRTMLELLNQLDGFEPSQNIKVLMATNRIDILDPALLRPGRIDRKIEFPNPNEASRLQIIRIHSRKMNLMRGINLRKIANQMKGASGAESKSVCTSATTHHHTTLFMSHLRTRLLTTDLCCCPSLGAVPPFTPQRGRDVCAEGEEGARDAGGLRDGHGQVSPSHNAPSHTRTRPLPSS